MNKITLEAFETFEGVGKLALKVFYKYNLNKRKR